MKLWKVWLGLIVWIALSFSAGVVGSVATAMGVEGWYRTLAKPSWTPPNWIFGPVWSTLYLLMGVAGWLVWKQAGFRAARQPLLLFAIQLVLNGMWSWMFFAFQRPDWALANIVLLWLAIVATIVAFFRRSFLAGLLLVPYLAWVSFATILNFAIWRLN